MTALPIGLAEWSARWARALPPEAVADLLRSMGVGAEPVNTTPPPPSALEGWTQSVVRLEAPRYGIWLGRNNVGAQTFIDDRGVKQHLRWGLANESPRANKTWKSGDLIGIRPVVITAAHIGQTIGQFVSRECKRPGWVYKGDEHEKAQLNWATLVVRHGGDAKFVSGEGSFN